jgi:hypothetical protein
LITLFERFGDVEKLYIKDSSAYIRFRDEICAFLAFKTVNGLTFPELNCKLVLHFVVVGREEEQGFNIPITPYFMDDVLAEVNALREKYDYSCKYTINFPPNDSYEFRARVFGIAVQQFYAYFRLIACFSHCVELQFASDY